MSSSDVDALRQLLAKRTEEVREVRAALDATQGALVNQRQTLKTLLQRAETLAPEKTLAVRIPPKETEVSPSGPNKVLAETSELVAKLGTVLTVLETESESKVASEKRRAEMFLNELRGADAGQTRGARTADKTMELEVVKAELHEALGRLAGYEQWEKEVGNLQVLKNHLEHQLDLVQRRISTHTGQPAIRSLRYELRMDDSVTLRPAESQSCRLVSSAGEDVNLAAVKQVVVKTSETLTCKVCLVRPVQTVVFPCMHLAVCSEAACGIGRSDCVVCGCLTTGTVAVKFADSLTPLLRLAEEISDSVPMEQ